MQPPHPSPTAILDAPAQNQDGPRRLWCLIEGESNVFQVIVAIHEEVSALQDAIKSRASYTLSKVDAYNLVLCKVSAIDESLPEVALAYSCFLTGRH